jgi:hypothetical protein
MNLVPSRPAGGGAGLAANVPSGEPSRDNAVAVQCDDVLDFQDCHSRFPTGCSQAAGYDADLNFLKDLLIPPTSTTTAQVKFLGQQDYQNLEANTPDGLSRGNHADFKDALSGLGEGQSFGLVGFLYYAKPSGVESSNCQLADTDPPEGTNVDYHIGIGFDPSLAQQASSFPDTDTVPKALLKTLEQNSVIVEMTPHSRFNFEAGIWTIENVRKAVGKQVRVVGQLLVDNEHFSPSQDCAKAAAAKDQRSCWRLSVWELHPVTQFQVCNAASCASDDANWVELNALGGGGTTSNAFSNPLAGALVTRTRKNSSTVTAKPQSGPPSRP